MSPLQPCPETPNCVHEAHSFQSPISELADHAVNVLNAMGAEAVDVGIIDHHEIHAVFKVWKFRDDVNIAFAQEAGTAILFIRSASRVGKYDLGVNRRRVNKFLKKLTRSLS